MDSDITSNSRWAAQLAEEYPQAAVQLEQLAQHLRAKQERLGMLIRFCASRPELPMLRMYTEYSAALDAVALEPSREEPRGLSDKEVVDLPYRERGARTKRVRTRTSLIEAAATLILKSSGSWRVNAAVQLAGVGNATYHNHFASRERLLVAAYEHLLANV